MKIAKDIRDLYDRQKQITERLKDEVVALIKPRAEANNWFFYARTKTLESYALKLETGRFEDPAHLEDFLGCTIVVQTLSQLEYAEDLISSSFNVLERRPANDHDTQKTPSDFRFDDIRIYATKKPSSSGKNQDLENVRFEIQLKTALQYAWGEATHDLTYKSDAVSWSLERIAYQLKAMLEHAEIAIASAETLSQSPGVDKKTKEVSDMELIISQAQNIWPPDRLPSDVKRMAQAISNLLRCSGLEAKDLAQVINDERSRLGGLPGNLSPYSLTLQALAHSQEGALRKALSRGRIKVLIHNDMELPTWIIELNKGVIRA